MADDSLDVTKINVKPEGKQTLMRDDHWEGEVQKMIDSKCFAKELREALEKNGIITRSMGADEMRKKFKKFSDLSLKIHALSIC